MNEIYTMDMEPKAITELLSKYYSKEKGKVVKVKESHSIGTVGLYESTVVQVRFTYEEETDILGVKAKKTVTIEREDILNILNKILGEEGYEVTSLNYKSGIRTVGFYDRDEEAYFNGITLTVKSISPKLRLK